jgi:hypothetical protein
MAACSARFGTAPATPDCGAVGFAGKERHRPAAGP